MTPPVCLLIPGAFGPRAHPQSAAAAPKLLCALGGSAPLLRAVPAPLDIRGKRTHARLTHGVVVLRSVS